MAGYERRTRRERPLCPREKSPSGSSASSPALEKGGGGERVKEERKAPHWRSKVGAWSGESKNAGAPRFLQERNEQQLRERKVLGSQHHKRDSLPSAGRRSKEKRAQPAQGTTAQETKDDWPERRRRRSSAPKN